jgi:hypothetical protein
MIAHNFYTRILTKFIQPIASSFLYICGIAFCANLFSIPGIAQVAETFPAWTEGHLDIHHINTGKGDAAFFMLPDGTTMLVDAGASNRAKPRIPDPKPDGSHMPGEWIARYISYQLAGQQEQSPTHPTLSVLQRLLSSRPRSPRHFCD